MSFKFPHCYLIDIDTFSVISAPATSSPELIASLIAVLFGTFFKQVPVKVVFIASVVALVAHFGIYYLHITPYMQETVNNPGVSAAIAILISLFTGLFLYSFGNKTSKR